MAAITPGAPAGPGATADSVPCADLAKPGPVLPPGAPAVVAVVASGDVWVWRDGEAAAERLALGDARAVLPSPDGAMLAVTRTGSPAAGCPAEYQQATPSQSLWVMAVDGTEAREVATSAALEADLGDTGYCASTAVDWLPNSHTLTWRVSPTVVDGFGGPEPNIVRGYDADKGQAVEPTDSAVLTMGLSWSPTGEWGAAGGDTSVRLLARDGRAVAESVDIAARIDLGHGSADMATTWLPDGSAVLVAAPQATMETPSRDMPFDLIRLSVPDLAATRLGRITADFWSGARLSPDGRLVAYRTNPFPFSSSNRRDLHLSDVAATWSVDIPSAAFVAWSPDSRHFLYRPDHPDRLHIGRLCAEPVEAQEPPGFAPDGQAAWVDAERFVYLAKKGTGTWRMYLAGVDGTKTELASFTSRDEPRLAMNR